MFFLHVVVVLLFVVLFVIAMPFYVVLMFCTHVLAFLYEVSQRLQRVIDYTVKRRA